MAGNHQICVAGWLSNMGDIGINYYPSYLLVCCVNWWANHSVQIDAARIRAHWPPCKQIELIDHHMSWASSYTSKWADRACITSKWAESAHTTSKWAESAHTTSKWTKPALRPPSEPNQLISPLHELNELNDLYVSCWAQRSIYELNELNDLHVSYRVQRPICELPSSTTYMWATELNDLYMSYQP